MQKKLSVLFSSRRKYLFVDELKVSGVYGVPAFPAVHCDSDNVFEKLGTHSKVALYDNYYNQYNYKNSKNLFKKNN